MRNARYFFMFVVLCSLVSVAAQAGTINVPGDQATITGAITAAAANDTILINAVGPYDEVVTVNKPLVIIGNGVRPNICAQLNAASPAGANDGFTITGFSGNVIVKNVNIIPSLTSVPTDDGVMIYHGAGQFINVTMESVVVCPNDGTNNPVTQDGLSLVDLTGKTVFGDDGMSITGLDVTGNVTCNFNACVISNNRNGGGNDGMVIFPFPGSNSKVYLNAGTVISYSNRIGIQFGGGGADIEINGSASNPVKILGAQAASVYAGLFMFNGEARINHCVLENNFTGLNDYLAQSAGAGAVSISNSIFRANREQGIIFADNYVGHANPLTITNCTFALNSAGPFRVDAADLHPSITFVNCVIAGSGDTTITTDVIQNASVNPLTIQNSAIVTAGAYSLNTTVGNLDGTSTTGSGAIVLASVINADPQFLQATTYTTADYMDVSNSVYGQAGSGSSPLSGGADYFGVTPVTNIASPGGNVALAIAGGIGPYSTWTSDNNAIASITSTANNQATATATGVGVANITVKDSLNRTAVAAAITVTPTSAPLVTEPQVSVIRSRDILMP